MLSPRRRGRFARPSRVLAALASGGLLVVLVAACTSGPHIPAEQKAAQAFLDALGRGDVATAAGHTTDPAAATATITASEKGLGAGATATLKVTALADRTKTSSTARYSAAWKLPGVAAPWSFTASLPMAKSGPDWQVTWSPAVLFTGLARGQHLLAVRTQPERANLLDDQNQPLFTKTPVVTVGIEPALVTNLTSLANTLAGVLAISAADIVASVKGAQLHDFVPVITLRQLAYNAVRDQIHDLHGTVFHSDTELLGPTARFAQPLLGRVGAATKDIIGASAGRVVDGDQTGLSGLQLVYDKQLAGTPGADVYSAADSAGAAVSRLATITVAKAGTPVRLSLDRRTQAAADAALAGVALPAAIVALQPSTGRILAVANDEAADGDIALDGQYPAGSTFKMVTYSALFTAKPALTAQTDTGCPATTTVDGRVFQNENRFDEGTVSISSAFAYSCNTSAINFNLGLGDRALATAAQTLGVGATWSLGVDAFSGSIPASATGTEKAAEAIGQGKVLVSPALMASIAGAVVSGRVVTPSLDLATPGAAGADLAPGVTAKLNTLMHAVVDEPFGTAHLLAGLPGDIAGKTGTAEFGTDVPPKSHSWMAGTRGDLAFAVFVYGGEQSSTAAVPLARIFLAGVPA